MLPILTEIAKKSRWNITAFEGKLHLSGRILSVIEAQSAGIASRALMMKMFVALKDDDDTESEENLTDDEMMMQRLESLKADDLLDFGKMQDRVVCQVTDKASQDGENFEKISFVPNEGQQNPTRNCLWVGLLSQDDKNKIFEAAMISVQEVSDQAENF
tara:strand:+ start:9728 stop:10204 length:477 start_codon:yes stop_codon:yes gene_type:complete